MLSPRIKTRIINVYQAPRQFRTRISLQLPLFSMTSLPAAERQPPQPLQNMKSRLQYMRAHHVPYMQSIPHLFHPRSSSSIPVYKLLPSTKRFSCRQTALSDITPITAFEINFNGVRNRYSGNGKNKKSPSRRAAPGCRGVNSCSGQILGVGSTPPSVP